MRLFGQENKSFVHFFARKGVNKGMQSGVFPANSKVFQILLLEREEIRTLKWIESEKANRDIGWDLAFSIWVTGFRPIWIKEVSGKNFQ